MRLPLCMCCPSKEKKQISFRRAATEEGMAVILFIFIHPIKMIFFLCVQSKNKDQGLTDQESVLWLLMI